MQSNEITKENINKLVITFYTKVMKNEKISPFFIEKLLLFRLIFVIFLIIIGDAPSERKRLRRNNKLSGCNFLSDK